jgi:hypothetical protein
MSQSSLSKLTYILFSHAGDITLYSPFFYLDEVRRQKQSGVALTSAKMEISPVKTPSFWGKYTSFSNAVY